MCDENEKCIYKWEKKCLIEKIIKCRKDCEHKSENVKSVLEDVYLTVQKYLEETKNEIHS